MSRHYRDRNEQRRETYNALRQMGFDVPTARKYRGSSWSTINRELLRIPPTDTEFLQRSTQGKDGRQVYWQKYRLLRSTGYGHKEARRLAKMPLEAIQSLTTWGHRQRTQIPRTWDYQPFDKGYTQPFVYKVYYERIDEETGEISSRWITLIKHEEMSFEEVESWAIQTSQGYGEQFNQIVNVIAMKAGLVGGVR